MSIITKIKVNTLTIITVLYAEVLRNLCMKPFDDDEIIAKFLNIEKNLVGDG